jgi:hypothetical protein
MLNRIIYAPAFLFFSLQPSIAGPTASKTEIYHKGEIAHAQNEELQAVTQRCLQSFKKLTKTDMDATPVRGLHITLKGIQTTTNVNALAHGGKAEDLAKQGKMKQEVLEQDRQLMDKLNNGTLGFEPVRVEAKLGKHIGFFVKPVFKKNTPAGLSSGITKDLGEGLHVSLVKVGDKASPEDRRRLAACYNESLVAPAKKTLLQIDRIVVESNHQEIGSVRRK